LTEEDLNTGDINEEAAVPPSAEVETHESEQSKQVPLSALESERAKRQQVEDENRMMREQFMLIQANQAKAGQKEEVESLDETDVMTYGDFKRLSSKMGDQFRMSIEELKMTQQHPDYQEVITNYLPEVLKQNPGLKSSLQQTQDYELAYYLAKNSENYRSANKNKKRSDDAERMVKNMQTPGSLSSLGGSVPVKNEKNYKSMSDDEFRAFSNKNLGY